VLAASRAAWGQTDARWVGPVNGNWTDGSKWSTAPLFPNNGSPAGGSYRAVIDAAGAAPYRVSLDQDVSVSGVVLNAAGATFDHDDGTLTAGSIEVLAGTYRLDGTLVGARVTGAGQVVVPGNGALRGATLAVPTVTVGGRLNVRDGLRLEGTRFRLDAATGTGLNPPWLAFLGDQTLAGAGEIVFDGGGGADERGVSAQNGTLTVGPGITIATGTRGGFISAPTANDLLINQGLILINAPGATTTLDGNVVNQGTIRLSAGTLNLARTFTMERLGTLERTGGTVNVTGSLDNTGRTLALNAATGSWQLKGDASFNPGAIVGGTVTASDGAKLLVSGFGTLDGVTLATDLSLAASNVTIRNGLTLSGSTIRVDHGVIAAGGNQTIGGSGEIVFDGVVSGAVVVNTVTPTDGMTLTIDPGVTIRTGLGGGVVGRDLPHSPFGRLVNRGVISAETPGRTMKLAGLWTNQGTIRVSAGTMVLGGTYKVADIGNVERLGGDLVLGRTLDNAGTSLTATPQTGTLVLHNTEVRGGTIGSAGGAGLVTGAATMRGVRVEGDFTVGGTFSVSAGSTYFDAASTLSGDNRISITGNVGYALTFEGTRTLGAPLEVVFDGATGNGAVGVHGGTLTLGPRVLIRSGLSGGWVGSAGSGDNRAIVNQGVVSSRTAGHVVRVAGSTVRNQGVLEAVNGGTLIAENLVGDPGTLVVGAGSRLEAVGHPTLGLANGRPIRVADGAYLALGGRWTNTGPITVDGGTLEMRGVGTNLADVRVNGGTFVVGGPLGLGSPSPTLGNVYLTDAALDLVGWVGSPQLATVRYTNVTVSVIGALNFDGQSLALKRETGDWYLRGGAIQGSVTTPDGTGLIATGAKPGRLSYVSLRAPLTIEAGATVEAVGLGGQAPVVNRGTLHLADRSAFTLDAGWSNTGTITVDASSTLNFAAAPAGGAFGTITFAGTATAEIATALTTAQVRSIGGGSSARIVVPRGGVVDNAGDTIGASAGSPSWTLAGGTLRGGRFAASAGRVLTVVESLRMEESTLDGVTLAGVAELTGRMTVVNGLTLDGTTSAVTVKGGTFASPPTITFAGSQTLGGTGEIRINTTGAQARVAGANGVLTIGPGVKVRGITGGGQVGSSLLPMVNEGVIRSEAAAAPLTVASSGMTNHGRIEAAGGGSVTVTAVLDGAGALAVDAASNIALTRGRQQSLTVAGRAAIRPKVNGGGTLVVSELSIAGAAGAWTGQVDVADNALVIDYDAGGAPLATVADQIRSGRAGGAWNGKGIVTSKSAGGRGVGYALASEALGLAGAQTSTFGGVTVDATSVLVRQTVEGDATLDGVVNFNDLVRLAQNYEADVSAGAGSAWYSGDFTYDGVVDFNDLVKLAQNYEGSPAPSGPVAAALGGDWERAVAAVPEPGGAGAVLGGVAAALGQRRRRVERTLRT
jgi:hypothetical protein